MNDTKLTRLLNPEQSLLVYGTLAPGRPNHFLVEQLKGTWHKGIVRGKLENKGWGAELGYYGFKPTGISEQREIEVFVLFSDELAANWQRLDDFEGDGYKRTIIPYQLDSGEMGVGYIYAINE